MAACEVCVDWLGTFRVQIEPPDQPLGDAHVFCWCCMIEQLRLRSPGTIITIQVLGVPDG